jgi:hypothetical protein
LSTQRGVTPEPRLGEAAPSSPWEAQRPESPRHEAERSSSTSSHALDLSVPGRIRAAIVMLRGENVLLDRDLAELYGVETRALLQAVRRNRERFPDDFAFQLTRNEYRDLRSQFVISSWGGRRSLPFAFTEQGVAMLSSVLRSERAVSVNVEIMRAFVRLRRLLASHADLARKLADLERKYDAQFKAVFDAIRALMEPPPKPVAPKPRIGFAPGSAK